MAGRFSTHRVAAPALVPAIEETPAETMSLTGLSEPAPRPRLSRRRHSPLPIRC